MIAAVSDATDPQLPGLLGPQDVVMVCNVLGPMQDALAETCLRNIVRLVAPSGYLVVNGVDLDLKTRVVHELKLRPVTDRIEEVHMADPTKRDWPWTRWGLEPFDWNRPDWAVRYASIYLSNSALLSDDAR